MILMQESTAAYAERNKCQNLNAFDGNFGEGSQPVITEENLSEDRDLAKLTFFKI